MPSHSTATPSQKKALPSGIGNRDISSKCSMRRHNCRPLSCYSTNFGGKGERRCASPRRKGLSGGLKGMGSKGMLPPSKKTFVISLTVPSPTHHSSGSGHSTLHSQAEEENATPEIVLLRRQAVAATGVRGSLSTTRSSLG